jgi:YggT family protein
MAYFIYIILDGILGFMMLTLFVYVVLSWLISLNVVNTRNAAVYQIWRMLEMLVNPMLEPVRRIIPSFGGLDLSVFLVGLLIYAVRTALLPKAFVALQALIG